MKKVFKFTIVPILIILSLFVFMTGNVFAAPPFTQYTVKYVDKDNNSVAGDTMGIGYVDQEYAIKAIKIKGYTLITDSPQYITLSADVNKNVIIYVYECTQYTISYDLSGGSVSSDNPASYNIKSHPIALINPTRAGYTFLGWTGTDLSGSAMSVTVPAGSTGDRLYKASWSDPVSYNITYDLGGGTATGANPATYNVESSDITLSNPQKGGYTFAGWSGTGVSGKSINVTIPKGSTGDRTYTANWADPASYDITYILNGGTVNGTNPAKYGIDSADITLLSPQKSGYKFLGWSGTGISDKSLSVTIPKGSTGNRTYTANWSDPVEYSITYNLDGGTVNGVNPVTYNVESSDSTLINPQKASFIFVGWSGTGISGKSQNVAIPKGSTGDRTYTANWSADNFTVTFAAGTNGSITGKTSFKGLHYGDNTPEAPAVTANEGWKFTGWSPKLASKVTDNVKYTAHYKAIEFTVKFVDYDGTVLSSQRVKWNDAAKAPASPSRNGYKFKGWDKAFDSIKADTVITAQYSGLSVVTPAASSSPSASLSPAKSPLPAESLLPAASVPAASSVPQEPVPLAGGNANNYDWIWFLLLILCILLILLLLARQFTVIPILEKIIENGDGTFTIQWGYLNRRHRGYTISKGKSVVSVIAGKIISSGSNAPVTFEKGRVSNAFSIVVDEEAYVEWKVKSRKASVDIPREVIIN